MPLIQLWEKNPEIVLQYNIKQIVSAAGQGVLGDDTECSLELRQYLANIPNEKIFEHIKYCLDNSFDKGFLALQDAINELGRRLDYSVTNGLYQGRKNRIGFDGIWVDQNGHTIVVEVKTTDAYRINLDTLGTYRQKLIEEKGIPSTSSILIVVGRDDTGDLEAQIRGSRHAWDTRIISTDALIKLVELKIKSDEDATTEKICSLLIPFEYTRLDNIIDVIFTTAKDVEASDAEEQKIKITPQDAETNPAFQEHTPREILDSTRAAATIAYSKRVNTSLFTHKRSQFWSADKKIRAVCAVSKLYDTGYFWYAFHPHQKNYLSEAENGALILACVNQDFAFSIPYKTLEKILPYLNITERPDRMYWHLHLQPQENGKYALLMPKKGEKLEMEKFILPL